MKVAYVVEYEPWLKNRMFDEDGADKANGVLERHIVLRRYLGERGLDLNTFDIYGDYSAVDIWLVQEPTENNVKFLSHHGIDPQRVIFFLHEPPVVNPWGWDYINRNNSLFKAVLTWETDLCQKDKKFFHYHFPVTFDPALQEFYKNKEKQNLCLIMHSNKLSGVKGELYSFRRKVIEYFEGRGDNLLDVFGYGWNENNHPSPFYTNLYKGTREDKKETYAEYYYSICIDNCVVPGYITYDPLVSMAVGTVPVYVPMPDSKKYIPEDTFVDLTQFKSFDDLVSQLRMLVGTKEYEQYRENGWKFINSDRYYPFTVQRYCEDVFRAVDHLRHELKPPVVTRAPGDKEEQVSPYVAARYLNPHFVKLLPMNSPITRRVVDPVELVSHKRFDVMAKYIYVKYRDMAIESDFGVSLYEEHIRVFNGYDERDGTGKKGREAFLHSFNDTIDSIKFAGFDPSKSMIPVTDNNDIIEGSHRLAASLYFRKPVHVLSFVSGLWDYDSSFFRERGLSEAYMDAMALQYCRLKTDTRIVLLFPSAIGKEEKVLNILRKYASIYYEKRIKLFNNGPTLLMAQVYKGEDWIGDPRYNYPGAQQKAHECFKSNLPLRVFLIETDNPAALREAKEQIRALYGISNHSVHINDSHEETVRVGKAVFNENSIHFMNHARPHYYEGFYRNFREYERCLPQGNEGQEYYCVGGSAVMSLYGLRESRDIDYLHFSDELSGCDSHSVSSHNKEIAYYPTTRDDVVFNPLHHFYFNGVKFASLSIIRGLKQIRGEEKDKRDVTLINSILKENTPTRSSVVGIVFSKNRAMQLDGTLRSFALHCKDAGLIHLKVLYTTSEALHEDQYETLKKQHQSVEFIREKEFKSDLIKGISSFGYVLFLVDDNIFINDFSISAITGMLANRHKALGFSLRLGKNITYSYMMDKPHDLPAVREVGQGIMEYDWTTVDGGYGYPLEVSSSVYRTRDLLPLLVESDFVNPNTLEALLDAGRSRYRRQKPNLLCHAASVTFCNPINKVQSVCAGNRSGIKTEYTPHTLGELFSKGYRIDVRSYSGHKTNAYHHEVELKFLNPDARDRVEMASVSPLVSIIILNYNGLKDIRACLAAIRKHTPERHEVIVIDNASTDGSVEYLRSMTDVVLVENLVNLGCPPARAQSMSLAKGEYVVFLDNDTVVTNGWAARFIAHMERDPRTGILGPRSNYVSGAQLVAGARYKDLDQMEKFAEQFTARHSGEITPVNRLVGFCTFVSRKVIDTIGSIDASFGKFGFEDDDYTWRAYIAGFRPAIAHDVFVHHSGGPQGRGNSEYDRALLNAWELFKKKWDLPRDLKHGVLFDKTIVLNRRFDKDRYYIPVPDRSTVENLIYKRSSNGPSDSAQIGEELSQLKDVGKQEQVSIEKQIAAKLYEQAVLIHAQGNRELALKQLELTLELADDNPEVHNDIGVLYFEKKEVRKAILHLERATRLDPENLDYRKNIADVYLQAGRIEEAAEYYGSVLEKKPDEVEVSLALARLCSHAGLEDKAKYYVGKVLEIEPDNLQARQFFAS